jgi:hypothetical protein
MLACHPRFAVADRAQHRFLRLLQPVDGRSGPELAIRKLAFPAPVELASISISANAFDDSPVCMAFHPQVARVAVAERKKIVIRTARAER